LSEKNNQNGIFRSGINRIFKILLILLPLAFAGNIIYTLISTEFDTLSRLLHFNIGFLLLAVLLSILPWFAQSARIIIWSRVFKKPVAPIQAFQAVLSSDLAAAATPTMLGGGYAKAGYLVSYGYSAGEATIITLLGTIEDAVFFAIALPTAVIWSRAWDNPYVGKAGANLISHWPIVLTVGATLLIMVFILNKFGKSKSSAAAERSLRVRIFETLQKYKFDLKTASKLIILKGKSSFVLAVIAAGIGWCSRYGAITALVLGLGIKADPILFFLLQWVVFTTMTMIPTPGAIGGAEVSFALIYNGLIPSFAIPVVTSGWRFMTFYLPVGLGSILFSLINSKGIIKNQKDIIIQKEEIKPAVYGESPGK
jgi:uncharacterized protein (TIRG00374 family)